MSSWILGASKMPDAPQPRIRVELRLAENRSAPDLAEAPVAGSARKLYLHREALVTASDILRSDAFSDAPGHFGVTLAFTSNAAKRMANATGGQEEKLLALLLDGDIIAVQPVSNIERYCAFDGFSKQESERVARAIKVAAIQTLVDDRGHVTVEIRLARDRPAKGLVEAENAMAGNPLKVYLFQQPIVSNNDIVEARVANGYMEGIFDVELTLTDEATRRFQGLSVPRDDLLENPAELARFLDQNPQMMAEIVGGRVVSAGWIVGKLPGRPQISGDFTREQAEVIVSALHKK
jgi:preprotein translocase subunit SecD